MKFKYAIHKESDKQELTITEFANLDKEILTPIAKETYKEDTIAKAISKGDQALVTLLRTKNMFPPGILAHRIAETIRELFQRHHDSYAEMFFDESDIIGSLKKAAVDKPESSAVKPVSKESLTDEDYENTLMAEGNDFPEIKLEAMELIEADTEYQDDHDSLEDDFDRFSDEEDEL